MQLRSVSIILLIIFALAYTGCESQSDGGGEDKAPDGDAEEEITCPPSDCAQLIDEVCFYPYPSMIHLKRDSASPTYYRVNLTKAMLPFKEENEGEADYFLGRLNSADGFSIATPLLAIFPSVHVDEATLPSVTDLASTVTVQSPVQVIDRETGDRLPVWAEMDNYAKDPDNPELWVDEERTMIIRPMTALKWNHRYTVVITDKVRDDSGDPLPVPANMAALISGESTDSDQIEALRPEYDELFTFLEGLDIPKASIVLAWEFHTMSRDFAESSLLPVVEAARRHMADNVEYTIKACHAADEADRIAFSCDEKELDETIWRRLEGRVKLPDFLNENGYIEWLDGAPVLQGETDVAFVASLPQSIRDAEAGATPLIQIGHGLLSATWRYLMVDADDNGTLAMNEKLGMIAVGFDFKGLCTDDLSSVMEMIKNFNTMFTLHDSLIQGMANYNLLVPFVHSTLMNDPMLLASGGEPLIDGDRSYFYGVSLGGIEGPITTALSPEIKTSVQHVGSAMFSSLLQHSAEFESLQILLDINIKSRINQQILLALVQRALDPIDPINFRERFFDEPFTGRGKKNILWQVSHYDQNAPDYGAYALQRSLNIPLVVPTTHEVFGVTATLDVPSAPDKSGLVIYDTGKEPPTYDNSGVFDNGAHHALRCTSEVQQQIADFFDGDHEGRITLHCGGEACFIEGIDCRTSVVGD